MDTLKDGQDILRAIAEYDDKLYQYIEEHTNYPREEDATVYLSKRYELECVNYDDAVDIAEMLAVIDLLQHTINEYCQEQTLRG